MKTLADTSTPRPGRGLRAFDLVLSLLFIVLAAASALLVPLLALQVGGRSTLSVDGGLEVPYTISTAGGSQIDVAPDGSISTRWDGPAGDDPLEGVHPPHTLRTTLDLARDDLDARLVAGTAMVLFLGAAWVGLVSLRRVVRSALAGDPFDPRNVGRVRWIATAVLSAPVVWWATAWLLEATIDLEPEGVSIRTERPEWTVYVIVGLGLLVLAEVFRVGAALQELERSTV